MGCVAAPFVPVPNSPPAGITRSQQRDEGPLYLAPELQLGIPLTPECDVYSLAMIAIELLTGTAPPSAKFRLSAVRPDLPGSVEILLRRCLDDDPAMRLRTPTALADGLQGFLEDAGGFRARARSAAARPAAPPFLATETGRRKE